MIEKKIYLAAFKRAAEKVLGAGANALKEAKARVVNYLNTPSTIGAESNSLYEGMEFTLPPSDMVRGTAECFVLQEYEGNEYVALLVECLGRLVPIAKGRFAREPRLVNDDGSLKRDGTKFATFKLEGTFFEVYRTASTFGESIAVCAELCERLNAHVKVGKPKPVKTSAYDGKNGVAEVLCYPMDFVDSKGKKIARNQLGLS